jgi:HPt (histidine-containing phosphotransfer) domain-containing protein
MAELVELYVAEMPDRIAALEQAFSNADLATLQRAAHQMKGAAGGYGFEGLTVAAGALETAVRDRQPKEQVRQALEELVRWCGRVRAGAAS